MNGIEVRTAAGATLLLVLAAILRVSLDRRVPPIDLPGDETETAELLEETLRAAEEADRRARPLASGETIDLNRAGEEELDRLPGIGPALAARIASVRAERGAFRSIDELSEVPGIGPAILARIRGYLALGPPGTP